MASPIEPDPDDAPALLHCSSCATVGYADDRYCPACGAPMLARCRLCGTRVVHLMAAYCTQCGEPLSSSDPTGR